jgi:hypothetical protein
LKPTAVLCTTVTEPSTTEFVCEICNETFESERALERHVHDVGLVD